MSLLYRVNVQNERIVRVSSDGTCEEVTCYQD
jgi:hypothetical protein